MHTRGVKGDRIRLLEGRGVYVSNVELEIYSRLPVNPADMADVQAGAQEFDPEFFGSSC